MSETVYGVMRNPGVTGRSFPEFDSVMAFDRSWGPSWNFESDQILETRTRYPDLRRPGLDGPCLSESILHSSHPLAKDAILSMVSLEFDPTLRVAAGFQGGLHRRHPGKISLRVYSGHGGPPSFERTAPLGLRSLRADHGSGRPSREKDRGTECMNSRS